MHRPKALLKHDDHDHKDDDDGQEGHDHSYDKKQREAWDDSLLDLLAKALKDVEKEKDDFPHSRLVVVELQPIEDPSQAYKNLTIARKEASTCVHTCVWASLTIGILPQQANMTYINQDDVTKAMGAAAAAAAAAAESDPHAGHDHGRRLLMADDPYEEKVDHYVEVLSKILKDHWEGTATAVFGSASTFLYLSPGESLSTGSFAIHIFSFNSKLRLNEYYWFG